jgi:hypothetical protein
MLKRANMGRAGKYLRLASVVIVLPLVTAILSLGVACQSTPSSPSNEDEIPPLDSGKTIPAYTLDIGFPEEEVWAVTLAKGESVTLPVTIYSMVDVPMAVRPTLEASLTMPEFISYEVREEFTALEPGDSIDTAVTISVGSNALSGDYSLCIGAELEVPVEDRSGMSICFTLTIADN